jgi:alpha-tubulin suppressor-like RCC1 family protein
MSVPGEMPDDLIDLEGGPLSPTSTLARGDSNPRGIYSLSRMGAVGAPPAGAVVLAFGDARRGQLGLEPAAGVKQSAQSTIIVVEELRGSDPVQVEACGVASFVVGARGQVWAFGSNRSMELGMRKEVTQVNSAQRVKSIRNCSTVQIAGSCSVSGQAHTMLLNDKGEVYTFGISSVGALGQGPTVTHTAPLVMRMSRQTRIKLVAAGAHHSLLITDGGGLYSIGDNTHGQLASAAGT